MATVGGTLSFILWFFLAALTISKTLSDVNAVRWLGSKGAAYRRMERRRERLGLSTRSPWRWCALDRAGGGFPPFGVTDYKLDRYVANHRWGRFLRKSHRGDRIAVVTLVLGYALPMLAPDPAPLWAALAFANAVLVLIVGIEAALSFSQLGSYLVAFHHVPKSRRKSGRTQELAFLGRIAARAVVTSWIMVHLAGTYGGAFKGVENDPVGTLYYVMTTLTTVGYGDIGPQTAFGQATAMVLMAQSATILIVVASGVMSVSDD